jgi:hypothetical protein
LQKLLAESESGSGSGPESESGSGPESDSEDFEEKLKVALKEAAEAEQQMSPKERRQYNAMVDAFKRNLDLERGLKQDEEDLLQDLLREERKEQKIKDSERLATNVRSKQLAENRKKFAGVQNGGKKRTIRKKNRKGTRTRTRQRKNRTRIYKKARKTMKRKTSRCHTFK